MGDSREVNREIRRLMNKSKFSKCLHPKTGECSKGVIKAHSIQNNRILKKISKNGEVISVGDELFTEGNFSMVGRKKATTFNGFCSKHDNNLFINIEEKDYMPKNLKQEFLFAYRALCREIIVKETSKNLFLNLLKEGKYVPPKLLVGIEQGLKDLEDFKEKLDSMLLRENFNGIQTDLIIFKDEFLLAVSSIFNIEYDFKNNQINKLEVLSEKPSPIFLTIFPQNGQTYVLISYLKKDSSKLNFLKKQLFDLSEESQKRRISSIICVYCENFAISPEKWEEFNNKRKFIDAFKESVSEEKKGRLNEDFNLFY